MRLSTAGAFLILLLLAVGCAAPAPSGGLLIAYNVLLPESDDDYEVFVMELDGSAQRNLTEDPGVDWVYIARGDRLYLVSDRDDEKRKYHLYEVGSDGAGLRQITPFRVRDSWLDVRSGGAELVVTSAKDGTPDLYLIDGKGAELRRLTNDPADDRDPIFSPDGRRVIWSSRRAGLDELWELDLESGDSRQLTFFPEDDPASGEHGYHAGPPAWVPHRDRISFCSKRNGNHSIFSISAEGGDLRQITPDDSNECWHAWSPDGRYLAYSGTDAAGNYDIYLREVESGTTHRLTEDPRVEQAPAFVAKPAPLSPRR